MSNSNPTHDLVGGRMEGTQVMNICVQGIVCPQKFSPTSQKTSVYATGRSVCGSLARKSTMPSFSFSIILSGCKRYVSRSSGC